MTWLNYFLNIILHKKKSFHITLKVDFFISIFLKSTVSENQNVCQSFTHGNTTDLIHNINHGRELVKNISGKNLLKLSFYN